MSRKDLVNKNWLANSFGNFRKRDDSPENFVRQSLGNITRVARITNLKKILDLEKKTVKEGPREGFSFLPKNTWVTYILTNLN